MKLVVLARKIMIDIISSHESRCGMINHNTTRYLSKYMRTKKENKQNVCFGGLIGCLNGLIFSKQLGFFYIYFTNNL